MIPSATMWKKNRLLLVGLIAALSAACGDDRPRMPTEPTVEPPSAMEPTITSVSVMGDAVLMGIGETVRLSLVAMLTDGSTRDLDPTLAAWESSDPGVARVAPDGVVTAVRTGQATISATYEQHEAELEMSVRIWVRLFCVGGPEGSRRGCERHGKSYLTRRRRGEEGDGGGSLTGGAIPSA